MKFEEVLPALREGKKIRRKNIVWKNYYGYLFVIENKDKIFSDSAGNDDYKLTKEDLLVDDWEIVKEPKKAKLRDLTKEQYKNWYKGYCYLYEDCEHCCFKAVQCDYTYERCWINHKDVYSDKFLNQEIEVEE